MTSVFIFQRKENPRATIDDLNHAVFVNQDHPQPVVSDSTLYRYITKEGETLYSYKRLPKRGLPANQGDNKIIQKYVANLLLNLENDGYLPAKKKKKKEQTN
jgi:hypothetical protein